MIKISTNRILLLVAMLFTSLSSYAGGCVVNAGPDQSFCTSTPPTITLDGTVGSGDTFQWETDGTGTFSPNNQTIDATYTPSVTDMENGAVTIVLVNTTCVSSDYLTIMLIEPLVANAGASFTMCAGGSIIPGDGNGFPQWTTSGSGTFSDDGVDYTPTYTPSAGDVSAGSVTLTLTMTDFFNVCTAVSDEVVVTISSNTAAVDAGPDQEMSATGNTLEGAASGVIGFSWATDGTGSFTPDATTLNAVYTPSQDDLDNEFVTLTLAGVSTCVVSDNMYLSVTTGIVSPAKTSIVSVYPNPVNNTTKVSLGSYNGKVEVKVINTSGVEILSESKTVAAHEPLDLGSLATLETGMYQLVIVGEAKTFTSRIMKK